jgi:hypothetical protein
MTMGTQSATLSLSTTEGPPHAMDPSTVDLSTVRSLATVPHALVIGHPQVPLSRTNAVALLGICRRAESFTHIHASQIKTCTALKGESGPSKLRCLGQTPPKIDAIQLGLQVSARDLQHVTTLFDQAHQLKSKSLLGKSPPANVTQFMSPLAFNNPNQSKDRALSGLIGYFLDRKSEFGDYTICSKRLIKDSLTGMDSESGLSRKFEIDYTKKGEEGVHTLILTEHAPEYRNGHMHSDAITKALKATEGSDPDVMLSYLGVGRVAIMQVVLDVKARIAMLGPEASSGDPSIAQMLDEAIEKVEAVRGGYISRKPEQKEAILVVLNTLYKCSSENPSVASSTIPTPVSGSVQVSSAEDSKANSALVAGTTDVGDVVDVVPAIPGTLGIFGLPNIENTCYANAGLKFMQSWLGEHFKVHPNYLLDAQGKAVEPYAKLDMALAGVRNFLVTGQVSKTAENSTDLVRKFFDVFTSDDLCKLAADRSVNSNKPKVGDQTTEPIQKNFIPGTQNDSSEFVTVLAQTLGIDRDEFNFNAPFYKVSRTLTHANQVNQINSTRQAKSKRSNGERVSSVQVKWEGPSVKLNETITKSGHCLIPVKHCSSDTNAAPSGLGKWIKKDLTKPSEEVKYNLTKLLCDPVTKKSDKRLGSEQSREEIGRFAREHGIDLDHCILEVKSILSIADASKPSKLALNLIPYTFDTQGVKGQPFVIPAFDLNHALDFDMVDQIDGQTKTLKFRSSAFVFDAGSTMNSGHYWMVVKNNSGNVAQWIKHNDSTCTILSPKEVKNYKEGTRPVMALYDYTPA